MFRKVLALPAKFAMFHLLCLVLNVLEHRSSVYFQKGYKIISFYTEQNFLFVFEKNIEKINRSKQYRILWENLIDIKVLLRKYQIQMFHSCLVCFIWVHLGRSKNFLSNNKKIDFKIVVNENVEKKLIEKNDRKNIENFPELNRKKRGRK